MATLAEREVEAAAAALALCKEGVALRLVVPDMPVVDGLPAVIREGAGIAFRRLGKGSSDVNGEVYGGFHSETGHSLAFKATPVLFRALRGLQKAKTWTQALVHNVWNEATALALVAALLKAKICPAFPVVPALWLSEHHRFTNTRLLRRPLKAYMGGGWLEDARAAKRVSRSEVQALADRIHARRAKRAEAGAAKTGAKRQRPAAARSSPSSSSIALLDGLDSSVTSDSHSDVAAGLSLAEAYGHPTISAFTKTPALIFAVEHFDGDLNVFFKLTTLDKSTLGAVLFQALAGVVAVQRYFGMVHYDLHTGNVLYKAVPHQKGHFLHKIAEQDWCVPHVGYVAALWDFEYAHTRHMSRRDSATIRAHQEEKWAKYGWCTDVRRLLSVASRRIPPCYASVLRSIHALLDAIDLKSVKTPEGAIAHLFGGGEEAAFDFRNPPPGMELCLETYDQGRREAVLEALPEALREMVEAAETYEEAEEV